MPKNDPKPSIIINEVNVCCKMSELRKKYAGGAKSEYSVYM